MIQYIIKRAIITFLNVILFALFMYLIFACAHYQKYTRMAFQEYFPLVLDRLKQYLNGIVLDGYWGISEDGTPVWEYVGERIPLSLLINSFAFVIYFIGGLLIGLLCALYQGSIFDWVWRIATVVYLPDNGLVFSNLFIPITAIAIIPMSTIIRIFRSELIEAKQHNYILLAQTKGMSKKKVLLRHSFRSSILPVITELPNLFIFALAGSFVVEFIYHIPGVSRLMYNVLLELSPHGTIYVLINIESSMVVIAFYILLSFGFNLLVDILMPLIDPRIKLIKTV